MLKVTDACVLGVFPAEDGCSCTSVLLHAPYSTWESYFYKCDIIIDRAGELSVKHQELKIAWSTGDTMKRLVPIELVMSRTSVPHVVRFAIKSFEEDLLVHKLETLGKSENSILDSMWTHLSLFEKVI